MARDPIVPENVHRVQYAHAMRAGDTVYTAGQVAMDPQGRLVGKGDIEAQTVHVFENLKNVLEAAGASLDDVVKLTTYATHFSFRPKIGEVRARYFQRLPATTFVVIESLADPDLLVEIEAIAVVE